MLAATSDYFRVMFSGAMAESKQDVIDLKGVTAEGLHHIIDFIYSGEIALTLSNLQEVIHTASHLQVMSALDLCSSYIKSLLTFDNAQDFLALVWAHFGPNFAHFHQNYLATLLNWRTHRGDHLQNKKK